MSWAGSSNPNPQLAGWWYRVGATVIDNILIVVVARIFGAIAGPLFQDIVLIAGDFLYVGLLVSNRGQTIGMQALSTRCVDASTGELLSTGRSVGRVAVSLVLNVTVIGGVLDVLWPLWDSQNQTLHDKAVGSVVVMTRAQVSAPPFPTSGPATFGGPPPNAGQWGQSEPSYPTAPPTAGGGGWAQSGGWQTAPGNEGAAPTSGDAGAGWQRAPEPAPAQSIPAAWYPDPGGSGQERWWDGKSWTEHLRAPS